MIPLYLYLFILIQLIVISYIDLKYRKIKNYWLLINISLSIGLFIVSPDLYPFQWDSFEFSFTFIFVGFVLFLLKIMGGGDSKYLASFFLLIPFNLQETTFYYLLMITIYIGIFMLIKNCIHKREVLVLALKNHDVQGVKNCFGQKFAYAPVILITWLWIGWEYILN